MTRSFALFPALALAACATAPKADPANEQPAMPCGASKLPELTGKIWTDAMQPDTLRRSGARTIRVIRPGMPVTMDYRPDRLNVELDADGRVVQVKCG